MFGSAEIPVTFEECVPYYQQAVDMQWAAQCATFVQEDSLDKCKLLCKQHSTRDLRFNNRAKHSSLITLQ